MRRLQYALRTLVGPWLALAMIPLEAANLLQRGAPWRGDALWTVDWMAIVLFIAGPLICGVAAVDAARLTSRGAVHLVIVTARPRLVHVRAMLWCVVPLIAVHTLALAVALGVSQPLMSDVLRVDLWFGFFAQLLAFVWYAALGSLLGRFVSPLLAGLGGAIVGLVAFHLLSGASSGAPGFELLWVGGATVSRIGVEWNYGYLLVQMIALAVTALLFVTVRVRLHAGRALPHPSGVIGFSFAITVIVVAQLAGPAPRNMAAAPKPPTLCFEGSPTICFHEQHARWAKPVARQIAEFADAATEAGYHALLPDHMHETSFSYGPDDPTIQFFTLDIEYLAQHDGTMESQSLISQLISPDHCPQLFTEQAPPDSYFENSELLAATWFTLAADLLEGEERHYYEGEPTLKPDEAAAVMAAFRRCELDVPA